MGKASRKRASKPKPEEDVADSIDIFERPEGEAPEDGEEVETIQINLGDMQVRNIAPFLECFDELVLVQAGKWARNKMDAEVKRLDSMGQASILMKASKLFVEVDNETESHTNCIEVTT